MDGAASLLEKATIAAFDFTELELAAVVRRELAGKRAARHAEMFRESLDVVGLEKDAAFALLVRAAFAAIGLTLEAQAALDPGELVAHSGGMAPRRSVMRP